MRASARIAISAVSSAGAISLWLASWYAPQVWPNRVFFTGVRLQLWAGKIIVERIDSGGTASPDPPPGAALGVCSVVGFVSVGPSPALDDKRRAAEARAAQHAGHGVVTAPRVTLDDSWRTGFGFNACSVVMGPERYDYVTFPVGILASPIVLWWVVIWSQRRQVLMLGRCKKCGYDSRASPERCPECGTAVGPSEAAVASPRTR